MKKLSLLFAFALLAVLCVFFLSSCFGNADYYYITENGEVTITYYKGREEHVVIPESIDGMPVVAIDNDVFSDNNHIRSVTIPDTVSVIGMCAFQDCNALERVYLGKGIQEIDGTAFDDCDKLIYNEYENGYYLGNEENPYMALISVVSKSAETFCFHPDTIIMKECAFMGCFSLREVNFSEGVQKIAFNAFYNCSSLQTVIIPQQVESISSRAFSECESLLDFVVSEDNPYYKAINGSLFSRDGTRLIKYTTGKNDPFYRVPDGVVSIEITAFSCAPWLTEVELSDSVVEIGENAFVYCQSLNKIRFGKSLKRIERNAFMRCESLTELTIPDHVNSVGYNAFSGCKNLETVVIGGAVSFFGANVFGGCESLREIVFLNPIGWKVSSYLSINTYPIDVLDSKRNVEYFREYSEYTWSRSK